MIYSCILTDYKQQSYNYSLIRENKTWFEAQLYCRKNHTDLVTIRNYEENERVKEARNGSNSFWIGLQYNTNVDWLDGGHSNYTQNNKSKGCFTFLSMHGFWVKSNGNGCSALCYSKLRKYSMLFTICVNESKYFYYYNYFLQKASFM